MNDQLNQTFEEATRAREKLIREANGGANWISRHPMITLGIVAVLALALAVLAVKTL